MCIRDSNMLTKAKEVMNAMVTGVITIVKELPQKIWNSIVGAVTKVATWGNNMPVSYTHLQSGRAYGRGNYKTGNRGNRLTGRAYRFTGSGRET